MYAIFEDGSRQYRVMVGDTVKLDYRDAPEGAFIEFQKVLLLADGENVQIGQPAVTGMRVLGEVVKHTSTKLYIQHFRRRKNYRRLKGHRQPYILVKVNQFLKPGEPTPLPAQPPAPATSSPTA